MARAQEISPDSYLVKPVVETVLMGMIGAALGMSGLYRINALQRILVVIR